MRWFILGTGPSLKGIDLDLLIGEKSIACNRIHRLYDQFDWRPDLYIFEDPNGNPYREEDMLLHLDQDYEVWLATDTLEWCKDWWQYENLTVFHRCDHDIDHPYGSFHLPHLCAFGGPVFTAVQLLIRDYDVSEICFLGCDGYYKKGYDNHMVDDYIPWMMGREMAKRLNRYLPAMHEIIAEECKAQGIRTFNASPGTKITSHKVIDLSSVLGL